MSGAKLSAIQLMFKNGDQGPITQNVWTLVAAWSVGNADTIISGEGLVAPESGLHVITESAEWSNASDGKNWRILVNGSIVLTGTAVSAQLIIQNIFSLTLNQGDIVTLELWTSSGFTARRTIKGGANTFLQLVPPTIWKLGNAVGAMRVADGSINSTSPVKSTGWSADPAREFSQVVDNALLMPKSGNVWFAFQFYYKWGWTGNLNVAAYVNGVQRGPTFTWNNTNSSADNIPWYGYIPITVTEGETVELWGWTSAGFALAVRAASKWWITPAFATIGMVSVPVAITIPASASATQITGWQFEPGSTVTSDALVVPTTKSYTLNAAVNITATNFQTSHTMEIRKNGVLIPGATVTVNTTSLAAVVLTIPSVTVSLAAGDVLTMWVSRVTGSTGSTIGGDQQTFIRLS